MGYESEADHKMDEEETEGETEPKHFAGATRPEMSTNYSLSNMMNMTKREQADSEAKVREVGKSVASMADSLRSTFAQISSLSADITNINATLEGISQAIRGLSTAMQDMTDDRDTTRKTANWESEPS